MIKPIFVTAIFSSVLFAIFQTGDFLRCYECNSHTNKNCSQKFPPNNTIVDCSKKTDGNTYTMCRKILQSIDFEVNGLPPDTRVIRSCAWDDRQYKNACYQRSGFGGRQDVCSCSTDLCNGSSTTSGEYTILAISILAIIIIAKKDAIW